METLLEQQRRYHEERDRLVDGMSKEVLHKKGTHREHINSDHRLKILLDRFSDCTNNLKELYEDKDGLRKEEIASLSGPSEYQEFYSRLKSIKEFHRKHLNEISVPMSVEFEEFATARENPTEDMMNLVEFTDEEGYGKYLDLHECYERYLNLKNSDKIDYISYLSTFDQLFDISKDRKNAEYRRYLEELIDYLDNYTQRVKPLLDIQEEMLGVNSDFEKTWDSGTFPGWPKEAGSALTHAGAYLDLSAFSSAEELASLGLDRLKSALMALGIKCGGTLEERAQRLFGTKGKKMSDLDPSLFTKSKPGKAGKNKDAEKQKEIACLEAQIYRFVEILSEQRHATKDNVQRRQARAEGEHEESDNEISESESEDEDDNEIPYNPKNLPLGWDGKPIPYWLHKLHGLNISYKCEICGNHVYKGPKAFQRHFAEWRHANGMRCLGIPNTAHFANVTNIADATALWSKLKTSKQQERWQPNVEEEFEDSTGNVVNKKTFEDLKRQGLL